MKALIIGATGATGKDLVQVLLRDAGYAEVVALVRRPTGVQHPKYTEMITDFDKLEEVSDAITGDVWFSCLGTTRQAAGSKEKQWHIDHDIPLNFAKIAKRNGVSKAVILSAYGASADSRVFYSRLKGTLDDDVVKLGFEACLILRPGFLLRKNTDRMGGRVFALALKCMNGLGLLRKFRPLPTSTLAEKLARVPQIYASGTHVIELDKIVGIQ